MPTDVLDTCSDLLPFHLLVEKVAHRVAKWLASLPSSHLLYIHIRKAASRYVKHHRVPLNEVMQALDMRSDKLEKIRPVRCRSKWEPSVRMRILECRAKAVEEAKDGRCKVQVYADRSGTGGGVGAAAVLFRNGKEREVLRKHLGKEGNHTVFEAKVMGMALAAKLIRAEDYIDEAEIGANSQAALRATTKMRGGPGQHLLDKYQG